MKIQNLKHNIAYYALFPKVVKLGVPTSFTLRGLGIDRRLRSDCTYVIHFLPQEENRNVITKNVSHKGYDEVEVTPDEQGVVHFTYTFVREQEYVLRLCKKTDGEPEQMEDLKVFAAAEDLWERIPMRGNTHCHTCMSDGTEDPALVAATYRKAGFDYLAITDHHTVKGSLFARNAFGNIPHGMQLYAGEEIHIPHGHLHAVNVGGLFDGMGVEEWYRAHKAECQAEVEALIQSFPENLPEGVVPFDLGWRIWIAEQIHKRGGVAILAHPFWVYDAYHTRPAMLQYLIEQKVYDAVEVMSGQELGAMEANMTCAFWNEMRANGHFIPVVGCDDGHHRNFKWDVDSQFNRVYTLLYAKNDSFEGFKEAVCTGYSAAVGLYDEERPHVEGTYRMARYGMFLLDQYFPLHDELCFTEGCLMAESYLGSSEALEELPLATRRVKAYEEKFFGRS